MRKIMFLLTLVLWVSSLAGCNLQWKTADNNKPVNSTETKTNTNTANANLDTSNITLYVDKNCETAWIQQCNPNIWKQQFGQILWSGNKLNIVYLDKDLSSKLKTIVPTTPVLSVPKDKISLFGQAASQLSAWWKLNNWVYYVPLYGWIAWEENLCNDGKDNNDNGKIDEQDSTCYKMTVLSSIKCKEPYCNIDGLKKMFMWYNINVVNYNTDEGKDLYNKLVKKNGSQTLPTFLFNKQKDYMTQMKQFITENKEDSEYKYQINIPQFKYDPSIETCAKDCNASPACKKILACNKTDKPKVELFVMSYCPYGTQAEKWILGVSKLLKDKIDFSIKFVNYSMHGKKEIDENNLQYCIQKEEPTKYNDYLTCFLWNGKTEDCKKEAKLDMKKENTCIEGVKKQFKTEENLNDKSTWLSWRFPIYTVYDKLNKQYGVQGSPTLVINWIQIQPKSRSPQWYLDAICSAFKNPPVECKKSVSNKGYDPMFGWTQQGKAAPAWSCGK